MRVSKTSSAVLDILQKQDDPITEWLAKLQIKDDEELPIKDDEELPQKKLNSLEDDHKSKLIPRAPDRLNNTQRQRHHPLAVTRQDNVHTNRYISYGRTCGGTITYANEQVHSTTNNANVQRVTTTHCNDCTSFDFCDKCKFILQVANSPDFINFNLHQLERIDDFLNSMENLQQPNEPSCVAMTPPQRANPTKTINLTRPKPANEVPELEVLQVNKIPTPPPPPPNPIKKDTTTTVIVQIPARRGSQDSGIQSDIASPQSDFVPSPAPHFQQPQGTEAKKCTLRPILPKPVKGSASGSTENLGERSAQLSMKSILNPDFKRAKWVKTAMMPDEDLFGKDSDGCTILHRLLKNDETGIAESFYATMEMLKSSPTKCEHIVAAETSICDLIQEYDHPTIFKNYFCEAVEFIRDNM